jgi:hypothetical protein
MACGCGKGSKAGATGSSTAKIMLTKQPGYTYDGKGTGGASSAGSGK